VPGAISWRLVPLEVLVIMGFSWVCCGLVTPGMCNEAPGRYTSTKRIVPAAEERSDEGTRQRLAGRAIERDVRPQ